MRDEPAVPSCGHSGEILLCPTSLSVPNWSHSELYYNVKGVHHGFKNHLIISQMR